MGALVRFADGPGAPRLRIAGIVPEPQGYLAHAQVPAIGGVSRSLSVLIRAEPPGGSLAAAASGIVRELDPRLP